MTGPVSKENIEQQFSGLLQGRIWCQHPQVWRCYVIEPSVHDYHTIGKDLQRWDIENPCHQDWIFHQKGPLDVSVTTIEGRGDQLSILEP